MTPAPGPGRRRPIARLRLWVRNGFREGRSPVVLLLAPIAGVAAGYGAVGLRYAIAGVQLIAFGEAEEAMTEALRALHPVHIMIAPVIGGCVVSALLWVSARRGWLPEVRAEGIADVVEARAVKNGKLALAPGLASAAIASVSLGAGASTGREGPAVHLGGTLASAVSRVSGLPPRAARVLLACGAASAVAASFNAPVAGALFAFEVVLGHYALRSIAPVAAASVTGALISRLHFGASPAFAAPAVGEAGVIDLLLTAPLGVLAAGLAIAIIFAGHRFPRWTGRRAEAAGFPLWALPPVGGLALGLIGLIAPEAIGVGYEATATALAGGYALSALGFLLAMKFIAAMITLAARFGGGVFGPSLYLGAMLGAAYGSVVASFGGVEMAEASFFALVGMGAVSGAVLGAPLSTTLIVFELTASYEAAVALLVAVSLATLITTSVTKGSLFQKQMERHGLDLTRGQARVILQTIRARDVMTPMDGYEQGADAAGPHVYEDDYLGRVLGFLAAQEMDGAAVRARTGDQPVIGYITAADAHAAYARALAALHEEEHR